MCYDEEIDEIEHWCGCLYCLLNESGFMGWIWCLGNQLFHLTISLIWGKIWFIWYFMGHGIEKLSETFYLYLLWYLYGFLVMPKLCYTVYKWQIQGQIFNHSHEWLMASGDPTIHFFLNCTNSPSFVVFGVHSISWDEEYLVDLSYYWPQRDNSAVTILVRAISNCMLGCLIMFYLTLPTLESV